MKTIPLTPVDYVFTGVGSQPITFVFYFSKRIHSFALKKSLDEALDVFSVLRSQLRRKSEDNYEYVILEEGYTFDVSETDLPFEEAGKVTDYITPVSSLEGHPLTKIRLTQTPNGSVLGVSISHALVDGFSYFYFMVSWANICRGEAFFKPSLDRDVILSHLKPKIRTIESDKMYSDCGLFSENNPGNL
ncbi:acyltransferase [Acidobacteriota bacterium]